ncbi:MAG: precorrin-6A synthase (deacetylating), partial [Actinobacteria bacterium]|nr:precorrin-6A synthase (deacetylating) [Actinomycetota bacterium]
MPENAEEMKGRTKEAAGDVTGDESLQREGKVEQASSTLKEKVDKGAEKEDLVRLRREICDRYIERPDYRIVAIPEAKRDRAPGDYLAEVEAWRARRAELWETAIGDELADGGCGGFLVWGDPSLYDGTLDVLERIRAGGRVELDYEVVPGISSVQALAAKHRIALNRTAGAVEITTGRRLAEGRHGDADDVVVMLDGGCAFKRVEADEVEIYWGANLGTDDERLLAGEL